MHQQFRGVVVLVGVEGGGVVEAGEEGLTKGGGVVGEFGVEGQGGVDDCQVRWR